MGFTSAHVLSEMAHRLMAGEAMKQFDRPSAAIARRLRNHYSQIANLSRHRQATNKISLIGLQIVPITGLQVSLAADRSRQYGLLSSDALVSVVMQHHSLTRLASHDADYDRLPDITRYPPV